MLNENIKAIRKARGLSQEELAVKLNVVRQTISKWELNETLPDICQSKHLSNLYHVTMDELIDFDIDIKQVEQIIENTDEKIDWTSV